MKYWLNRYCEIFGYSSCSELSTFEAIVLSVASIIAAPILAYIIVYITVIVFSAGYLFVSWVGVTVSELIDRLEILLGMNYSKLPVPITRKIIISWAVVLSMLVIGIYLIQFAG
jgi:hypothetical protein